MAVDSFEWVVVKGFRWFWVALGGFSWLAVLVIMVNAIEILKILQKILDRCLNITKLLKSIQF